MPSLPSLLSPIVIVALSLLAARLAPRALAERAAGAVVRALASRAAPVVAGLLTGIAVWWVWGSLARTPVMHDESAYLLQAQIFARFHWTAPPPPIAAFFEQLYVLVDGVLAAKYPPGNSLVIALGALVGAPGLAIVATNAGAGALVFALARRIGGAMVAAGTWLLWLAAFPTLYFRATYMSESVSTLAFLGAWWCVFRWRDRRDGRWLAVAAASVAWCAITRPMTGLALGVAVAVAVAAIGRRSRVRAERQGGIAAARRPLLRDVWPSLGAAALVLAIVPLWSWRTTGDAAVAPLTAYTATYVPFDHPGFGVAPGAAPARRLPRDLWLTSAAFYQEHERHTLAALPQIAAARLAMLAHDAWYGWRAPLALCALIALAGLTASAWAALGVALLQVALYLTYAHPAVWTLYYAELSAIPALIGCVGAARLLRARSLWRALVRPPGSAPTPWEERSVCAAALLLAAAALAAIHTAVQVRAQIAADHAYYDTFAARIDSIPATRALVFVRYAPTHNGDLSLVRNVADAASARVLTAYDRGARDDSLVALLPDRAVYVFDEASGRLTPWSLTRAAERTTADAGEGARQAGAPRRR